MWSCRAGEETEGELSDGGGVVVDGDRGERDFPLYGLVMRASNKVDVFMDN